MAEYTYKDIIIDPTSEEAKNAVGKECYFGNSPTCCLNNANANNKLAALESIKVDYAYPFINENSFNYGCFIVKKEEPKPRYVPFESKEEFIEAYHYHDNANYSETEDILMNYGMWLKSMCLGNFYQVTIIKKSGIFTDDNSSIVTWEQLLEKYTFLDRSPCGKEVKDE